MLKEKEELLMELLWDVGTPLTSVEMADIIPQKSWSGRSDANIHRVINSLLQKDMLQVRGYTQYRTQYARRFEPTMSREEYIIKLYSEKNLKKTALTEIALALLKVAIQKPNDSETDQETFLAELESILRMLKEQNQPPKKAT